MADEKQHEPEPSYLVEWDGDSDPLDPRNFSKARKWFYVAVVATGSLLVLVFAVSADQTCTNSS